MRMSIETLPIPKLRPKCSVDDTIIQSSRTIGAAAKANRRILAAMWRLDLHHGSFAIEPSLGGLDARNM